jgi:HAD superfamily hydrolase (TIGR01509 family)
MRSASELDAVTIDGFGTLLELEDPTERLCQALADRGVQRDPGTVRSAFHAEAAYYRPRSLTGGDAERLASLRVDCVRVFLEHAKGDLDPASFVEPFLAAIVFHLAPGALEALEALAGAGLALACVANWDMSLVEHLRRLGVSDRFGAVVPSALAGVEKPDPRIFELALRQLGVDRARALHIGDDEADRLGAQAAGLAFVEPPLASLPERLGL